MLQWDGDGFALYEKGLERGTFERPVSEHTGHPIAIGYNMTAHQLQYILNGVVLKSIRYKKIQPYWLKLLPILHCSQLLAFLLPIHCFIETIPTHTDYKALYEQAQLQIQSLQLQLAELKKGSSLAARRKLFSNHPIPMWCNQTCSLMINW
ncbi:MAG: transposase [Chitinophagaceae bacterium]|nr:transposase [Chitinophagaceae bacterium]